MAISKEQLEKRAVKKGVKASRKLGHLVTPRELLGLKVQVMGTPVRALLVLAGLGALACSWLEFPSTSDVIQGLEAIAGILLILFGCLGIRSTLENVVNGVDPADGLEVILELIGEALSGIDL